MQPRDTNVPGALRDWTVVVRGYVTRAPARSKASAHRALITAIHQKPHILI